MNAVRVTRRSRVVLQLVEQRDIEIGKSLGHQRPEQNLIEATVGSDDAPLA